MNRFATSVGSSASFVEQAGALTYPKLQAVIGDADELIELLALAAIVVAPSQTVTISPDPDDDLRGCQ